MLTAVSPNFCQEKGRASCTIGLDSVIIVRQDLKRRPTFMEGF